MKILVVGEPARFSECRLKFPDHSLQHVESHTDADALIANCDVVFDFIIGKHPEHFHLYATKRLAVFLNTATITLASLVQSSAQAVQCTAFGFNGFPTFFNRELLEVCVWRNEDALQLEPLCKLLKTEFLIVDDRVGLVTPRVICMIINEAYYTVQEKTASRNDIDLAMKLGTNYPYGPFEWCERIGLKNVYELLSALYDDTKDERYKISALMKKEYMGIGY
ncbi:MAG TPA: 3-hydroxyacyl-CoA dehydrogenase family protein [Chryseosolibacter sp.]|nr:3-hydroxyacyl-CoA dehydrogenase family protein [Chryseosolibacter sp.]